MERFEGGQRNREIAAALRVSERSVERWRRQWRERGRFGPGRVGCLATDLSLPQGSRRHTPRPRPVHAGIVFRRSRPSWEV
ncbi:helix-turn-helix domain-containing protein [Streptomyces sp. AD2-2]|nr:helix-turn-helix domain-containing protein [Streptomyces sp. AD2-2]